MLGRDPDAGIGRRYYRIMLRTGEDHSHKPILRRMVGCVLQDIAEKTN